MRLAQVLATHAMLLVLLCCIPGGVDARQWRMTPSARAQEYSQIIDQRSTGEMVIVWWVAPEVLEDSSPGTKKARSILRQYMLVGVAHTQVSALGQFTFQTPRGLRVRPSNATARLPLDKTTLPPAVAGVVSVLESTFSQAMGQFGRGVHWYVFDGKGIGSCRKGAFWIAYAGEQYSYATPIPGCDQRTASPTDGPPAARVQR